MAGYFNLDEARVVETPEVLYKLIGGREVEFCVLLLEVAEAGGYGRGAKFYRVPVECWGQLAMVAVGLEQNEVLKGVSGVVRSRRWVGKKDGLEHFDVVLKAMKLGD